MSEIDRLTTRVEELTEENAELREEINSLEYAMEDEARIFKDRITELEQQLVRTQQFKDIVKDLKCTLENEYNSAEILMVFFK